MKHQDRRHATRSLVLDAAIRIIEQDGLQGFTLEAVAKEAGLSKGGVFYHFESKHGLVRAMLETAMEMFEQRVEELLTTGQAQSYAQAFVLATIEATTSTQYLRTTTALCAAIAGHPELLEPYVARSKVWQTRLEQGGASPARATVARLAADGLFYAALLGAGSVFAPQHADILVLLTELSQPEPGRPAVLDTPTPPTRRSR